MTFKTKSAVMLRALNPFQFFAKERAPPSEKLMKDKQEAAFLIQAAKSLYSNAKGTVDKLKLRDTLGESERKELRLACSNLKKCEHKLARALQLDPDRYNDVAPAYYEARYARQAARCMCGIFVRVSRNLEYMSYSIESRLQELDKSLVLYKKLLEINGHSKKLRAIAISSAMARNTWLGDVLLPGQLFAEATNIFLELGNKEMAANMASLCNNRANWVYLSDAFNEDVKPEEVGRINTAVIVPTH
ncbi:MAG: hypothetical protein NTX79_07345 [Candidatus Micrarchaeota archaeon]|nr:hypothetical protein [Candidatus Micrarchaeota archaeon]